MRLSKNANAWAKSLIIVAVLVVFSGMLMYYFKARYEAVVTDQRDIATRVANRLELFFNGRLLALQFIAADPVIQSLEPIAMRQELTQAIRLLDLSHAVIVDLEGNILASAHGTDTLDFTREIRFHGLTGQTVISNSSGEQGAYIDLQVPIYGQGGALIGVFAAGLPIAEVANVVERQNLPLDQFIFVMDSNANLIYHPQFSGDLKGQEENSHNYLPGLFQKKTGDLIVRSMFADIDELNVYTVMEKTNWRIVAAMPIGAVYAAVLWSSLPDIVILILLLTCIFLLYSSLQQARSYQKERETLRLERLSSVNQLAAGIAHEIRNPLTSIKGFMQLIAAKPKQPASSTYLEIVLNEVDRIEKLVNEFQMLSRPLKPPHFEKIDLAKIIGDVILLMESQASSKCVKLEFHIRETSLQAMRAGNQEAYTVWGDVAQLKQVWINLVRNALEAVVSGGKVKLALFHQEDQLVVTIKDNGPGIPAEILEKLGTPFFTTKEGGTGLGLSVCYSIIQNHNGKMEVASKMGEGTQFTVLLPSVKEKAIQNNVTEREVG